MEALSLLFCAIFAGAVLPVQSGLNMQLAKSLGHPLWGALVSFGVGTLSLSLYALLSGVRIPSLANLLALPFWLWCGGALGAFFVFSAIVVSPRLGAATSVALFIAGQMLASLLLDHFGMVGFPVHPANFVRILGAALVVAGVVLIRLF